MGINQLFTFISIKIELRKLIIFLAINTILFGTINAFSSSPNISMTRIFSDSICSPGEEIIITISLKFDDLSNNARGIYLVDNIPNELAYSIKTLSVKLDITDITNSVIIEKDSLNNIYDKTTAIRWILETPPWFSEGLQVHPFEEVIVMYSIIIPQNAEERTSYYFPNASWVAVVDPYNNPSFEFGFEDFPNPVLTVDITNQINSRNELNSKGFYLSQNYPNPFNPSSVIKFGIPVNSNVRIEVFNMRGQKIDVLVNSRKSAGYYEVIWYASDFPSGVYFISIIATAVDSRSNFRKVKKALLLK